MATHGLLVWLEAQHGHDDELEACLRPAQALVRRKPATSATDA
jgi:hypothetical protein